MRSIEPTPCAAAATTASPPTCCSASARPPPQASSGSPVEQRSVQISEHVADLSAYVRAELPSDQPPVLVGHSFGGATVLKYLEAGAGPAADELSSMIDTVEAGLQPGEGARPAARPRAPPRTRLPARARPPALRPRDRAARPPGAALRSHAAADEVSPRIRACSPTPATALPLPPPRLCGRQG